MQSRAFNTILIDKKEGVFTKSSLNTKKLQDEVNYYLEIPSHLNSLFPVLLDYSRDYTNYKIEYFPYNNLADLFLNANLSLQRSQQIISKLLLILDQIQTIKKPVLSKKSTHNFYINKTLDRLEELKTDPYFTPLIHEKLITINGVSYLNFCELKQDFCLLIKQLSQRHSIMTAMHGDFSLSNILYSPGEKIIKLIDPRGSFNNSGIYGDGYYDFAKLMHCLHGKYDLLVNDNFQFEEVNPHTFKLIIPTHQLLDGLYYHYVELLIDRGMNLEFIYLIEASLFLSMVPLHYENPQRQKAFYLNGLIILNKVLGHQDNYSTVFN